MCDGTQFMVVDCGSGTVDVTVHRVHSEWRLAEVIPASGYTTPLIALPFGVLPN
jgi:molecular chaperone DnaK (HSP70)